METLFMRMLMLLCVLLAGSCAHKVTTMGLSTGQSWGQFSAIRCALDTL